MSLQNIFLIVTLLLTSLTIQGCLTKSQKAPIKNAGIFKDSRDEQSYKWVRLKDGKKWMAQNLNFETSDSWCHGDDDNNCEQYGRLYTWQSAMQACPKKWRLPTNDEWWDMVSYYKDEGEDVTKYFGWYTGEVAYKALVQGGSSGFSAQHGGGRNQRGGFRSLGVYGHYWSSSEDKSADAWAYYVYNKDKGKERVRHYENEEDKINRVGRNDYNKGWGQSCRCIQE